MTEIRIPYPINDEDRRALIRAGLRAVELRERGLVESLDYDRAHAEIVRIEERLRAAHGQTEAEK